MGNSLQRAIVRSPITGGKSLEANLLSNPIFGSFLRLIFLDLDVAPILRFAGLDGPARSAQIAFGPFGEVMELRHR